MPLPEIDSFVDYRTEYNQLIKGGRVSGDNISGRCPFHDDQSASFSANIKTGQWKCHAENISGNFITFWAKYYNTDEHTALLQIQEKYHINTEKASKKHGRPKHLAYTLDDYARDKGLPTDFLSTVFGLWTGTDKRGIPCVCMPYISPDGVRTATRKRFDEKGMEFDTGDKPGIYGGNRMSQMDPEQGLVIVEGESDTQSMVYMGFTQSVGFPGASTVKKAGLIESIVNWSQNGPIAVHMDNDKQGQAFGQAVKMELARHGHKGSVRLFSCAAADPNCKDPSDLFQSHGKAEAERMIRDLITRAKVEDVSEEQRALPDDIPEWLQIPDKYQLSDEGIALRTEDGVKLFCYTPLIITRRVRHVNSNDEISGVEEKVELGYRIDGKWKRTIQPREKIFTTRGVTSLSTLGIQATSENAKYIVKYLDSLQGLNRQSIPVVQATSHMGWQEDGSFLPGCEGSIIFDGDPSTLPKVRSFTSSGTLAEWVELMKPCRSNDYFRIVMGAGAAAPLLRPLKERNAFLYIWDKTRSGKTAALKAMLSIWGDPDKLAMSFNTTVAGMERYLDLFNDLPIGMDEKQESGKTQAQINDFIYSLVNGRGKNRATRSMGMQRSFWWRSIIVGTGEEPLLDESSQDGTNTRTFVINGAPFDDEKLAHDMHQKLEDIYGAAGPEFIRRVIATPEEQLQAWHHEIADHLIKRYSTELARASTFATIALGDALLSEWIFGLDHDQAFLQAKRIAGVCMTEQINLNTNDTDANAKEFIDDWININSNSFGDDVRGQWYGWRGGTYDPDTVYIVPAALKEALKKEGYSPVKTYKCLADQGIIDSSYESSGKRLYSVVKRNPYTHASIRVICYHMGKMSDPEDSEIPPFEGTDPELPY